MASRGIATGVTPGGSAPENPGPVSAYTPGVFGWSVVWKTTGYARNWVMTE